MDLNLIPKIYPIQRNFEFKALFYANIEKNVAYQNNLDRDLCSVTYCGVSLKKIALIFGILTRSMSAIFGILTH